MALTGERGVRPLPASVSPPPPTLPVRLLSLVVALLSFVMVLAALLLAGPHSDIPGQPTTSIVVALVVIIAAGALVRALWRRRPGAAWGLPLWAGGVAIVVLGLTATIASPAEWPEARPALAVGLALWGLIALLARRYVRRRVSASGQRDTATDGQTSLSSVR